LALTLRVNFAAAVNAALNTLAIGSAETCPIQYSLTRDAVFVTGVSNGVGVRIMKKLQKFLISTSGNFALWFALASVPLFGMAGIAIDYSRMTQVQAQLQDAADTATLAAVIRYRTSGGSAAELENLAKDSFKANYTGSYNNKKLEATADITDGIKVTLTVEAENHTTLLNLVGKLVGQDFSTLRPKTLSQAGIGLSGLAIALAVDTTGSMAETGNGNGKGKNKKNSGDPTKMDVLKEAATNFVKEITPKDASQKNKIRFALVPFTDSVRIDNSFTSADFIKISNPYSKWKWMNYNWEGCVWDRAAAYDNNDNTPTVVESRYENLPAGHQAYNYCPGQQQVIPLTTNEETIFAGIDALEPNGATNTNIGMVWAMNTLNNTEPYKQINAMKAPQKIIIFLTDGENTSSRIMSEGGKTIDVDKAMETTCENAKAQDIEIYTIRLIQGSVATLKKCATDQNTHFYTAMKADDLKGIFSDISERIWNSHVALMR
jgi:Flp pilus assembly protein TadG